MKLFPTTEEKKLKTLLKMAVEPKEALNLDALHGFLFGLAITPEPVNLSEWLPCIFGKQLLRVEGRTNSLLLLEPLFNAYNRLMKDQYDGDLMCPFADLEPEKVNRAQIGNWARGFFASMQLRWDFWDIPHQDGNMTQEEEVMAGSIAIVAALAMPDQIVELMQPHKKAMQMDEEEFITFAFDMLPSAVATLQAYAINGNLEGIEDIYHECFESEDIDDIFDDSKQPELPFESKISRNDPCPCGSGKKYKKCCGK